MHPQMAIPGGGRSNTYLYGRGPAWFAYSMTVALMIFDYIDRQIIASMFPFLKSDWLLTDSQLGALVSVVSVTVAVFGIPVAWIADRFSRVKSITVMAMTWSIATIACMFSQGYAHLLVARAFVGLGEAGYGSVGAAMVATHFPQRMRGGILGGFFASASVGSVLGVVLGGVIASRFGWHAGFGLVGVPGLVLSLLYLFVRDYKTRRSRRCCQLARDRAGPHCEPGGYDRVDLALPDRPMGLRRRRGAADLALGALGMAAELPQSHPTAAAR
jgi:MFS family permease